MTPSVPAHDPSDGVLGSWPSQPVDRGLAQGVVVRTGPKPLSRDVNETVAQWRMQNHEAISAYNAQIDSEGTFAQHVNAWLSN
jgi:2-succinyl-5-enolpyruvyl-6-hydroxy-3-cyclohexene-1-carboxylate synthase